MDAKLKYAALRITFFTIIYILLGNAKSVQPNPYIPGAIIAFNMIIPVIAGMLFGPGQGALVGLLGTALNSLTPAGSAYEIAAILPHTIMGASAGFARNVPPVLAAGTILVGHLLNLLAFLLAHLITPELFLSSQLWMGLAYETLIDILAITVISSLIRICFKLKWH